MRMMRPLLGALAAAAAALFAGPAGAAETVKVGVILSYSGQGASLGEQMDRAIRLYLKEHEKELGDIKLEIIRRDDTGPNPDVAKRLAQELITRDKINILTGFIYTPNANAAAPLATEAKVPMIIMNAGTSSTVRLSPYIVRTSFTLYQQSYPLGVWAAKQGFKTAYTAVTDYGPGHDGEAAFSRGFTESGGKIVGSVRIPLRNADYVPFFQRIKDEKPEALFVFAPGGKDGAAAMKTFADLGLAAAGIKLIGAADLVSDDELPGMGDVPTGIITMGYYSAVGDRPANKKLIEAWKRDYGAEAVPNPHAIGAWDGMAAIFHIVKAQKGKIDADKSIELLKGWRTESPRGPLMIDPETRDVVQNMYVRRLERVNGKLANVEFETVPMVKDPWPRLNPAK